METMLVKFKWNSFRVNQGVSVVYPTRAIITRGLYMFYPIFTAVYIIEWLLLQAIYVVNKSGLWWHTYDTQNHVFLHVSFVSLAVRLESQNVQLDPLRTSFLWYFPLLILPDKFYHLMLPILVSDHHFSYRIKWSEGARKFAPNA